MGFTAFLRLFRGFFMTFTWYKVLLSTIIVQKIPGIAINFVARTCYGAKLIQMPRSVHLLNNAACQANV